MQTAEMVLPNVLSSTAQKYHLNYALMCMYVSMTMRQTAHITMRQTAQYEFKLSYQFLDQLQHTEEHDVPHNFLDKFHTNPNSLYGQDIQTYTMM